MRGTLVAALVLGLAGCQGGLSAAALDRYPLSLDTLQQWKLPKKLREISGLAVREGRLYTHDDQSGIVYEIDYEQTRLNKAFALGRKTVKEDFEGIAIAGERFFLVTSRGKLYEFREGANGERVAYRRHDTGLRKRCEIEGLDYDALGDQLLIVCKRVLVRSLKSTILIYAWSLQDEAIDEDASLIVRRKAITRRIPGKEFNPSGIAIDPQTGHILLVAARQRALAELDTEGRVIAALELPLAEWHRQAEGIAILPDGRLALADEGGTKRARMALYRPGQKAD